MKDRTATLLIAVWILSYLMPLCLFFAPALGLPVNPRFPHGRLLQILVAIGLTIFLTVWNYGMLARHRRFQQCVREIRARGGFV